MSRPVKKFAAVGGLVLFLASSSLAYLLWFAPWPVGTNLGYSVNANTAQVADELAAVISAAATWSSINPAGFRMTYQGPTGSTTAGFNGENAVAWVNEGNISTLATAWAWSNGTFMIETDMVFNDFHPWSTSGGGYDIETVALHEFGHWINLDHSATGIMTPSYGGTQHTIDADARAGFVSMYGGAPALPSIELNRSSLSFAGSGSDTFAVRNSGSGSFNYSVTPDSPWIAVNPGGGSTSGEWDTFTVTVDATGLGPGGHSGEVIVASATASNSPQSLDVNLNLPSDDSPNVQITSPQNGATTTTGLLFEAEASDDNGVTHVNFYVDGELKKSDSSPPYQWRWDSEQYSIGSHTVLARAYDTAGQTAEDSIDVEVVDNPPVVDITSPASGTVVTDTIEIRATASDDNGVTKVNFYVDDQLKHSDTSPPYTWVWDSKPFSSGFHTLRATAFDTIDQTTDDSILLKVDKPPQ
ncbi:Ig-like domain-containing protein, partial [Acidobacteriota bacterium]